MQLDFDLHGAPPKPPEPTIHSVTELTRRIRGLIEKAIGEVWVEGEISNPVSYTHLTLPTILLV